MYEWIEKAANMQHVLKYEICAIDTLNVDTCTPRAIRSVKGRDTGRVGGTDVKLQKVLKEL
jgi:hypothetical protein